MAQYQRLDEPVFINKINQINSQYGGEVWEVEAVGIRSQTKFKTYCDPRNVNWRVWEHIIECAQRKGMVISNLKMKDPQKGIINADSNCRIEWVGPREDLAQELDLYWKQQSKYHQLFGD
jgi:hypothetical protein